MVTHLRDAVEAKVREAIDMAQVHRHATTAQVSWVDDTQRALDAPG